MKDQVAILHSLRELGKFTKNMTGGLGVLLGLIAIFPPNARTAPREEPTPILLAAHDVPIPSCLRTMAYQFLQR